jgi:hypothetical protein
LATPQENKRFNVKGGRLDSLYASTSGGGRIVTNSGSVVAEWGQGGGTNFDFHGFAGYDANRAANYTVRSFTDKNYVDSSLALKWGINGNGNTIAGTNFIGTTDDVDFVIKRNNLQVGRFYNTILCFGQDAGDGAINASYSNLFGANAGYSATNASNSNFLGQSAGYGAIDANGSNFFGLSAGNGATEAYRSNFIGQNAGQNATNASFSNFFGTKVGSTFSGNNVGANNIIIGTNISLPNATANAINLGGVLFGTDTYSVEGGDPSIAAQSNGKIGIRTVTPAISAALEIGGTTGSVLLPRLNTTETNALTGVAGMVHWNSDSSRFVGYTGTAWKGLAYTGEGGGGGLSGTITNDRILFSADGTVKDTSMLSYSRSLQSVGIGIATPAASALLDLTSTTKGFLEPRATTSEINAVTSPALGLQMYNSDIAKEAVHDGVAWSYNEVLNMKIHKGLGSPVKAWTADIYTATATAALTDGQMQYQAIYIDEKATLTGVKYMLNQAGNFTGDNTNSISLFSYSAGTLTKIAETANDQTIFKATANQLATVNFAATAAVNPGVYYIGILYNSSAQTTAPSFRAPLAMGVLTFNSLDYTNSAKLNGVAAASTAPSSIATTAISTSNFRYLIGVF